MKVAMKTENDLTVSIDGDSQQKIFIDLGTAALIAFVIGSLNMIWFSFDYHFPSQDEAEHIMNSIVARGLLSHIHPFSSHWWYQVLTINCYYPPFAYLINGFFFLLFGQSRLTEQLALSFFVAIMTGAIYITVRLLSGSRLAATLSVCCLAMFPLICKLSHGFYLDLPEVAMTAIGLMTLLWWQKPAVPSWKRTIITGIVLAIACLTKQLVAAYLIPVALYFLLNSLGLFDSSRKLKLNWLIHLFSLGTIAAAIGLPFILINYKPTHDMTSMIMGDFALKKVQWSYFDRLKNYLLLVPQIMSPLFFILAGFSFVFIGKEKYIKLMPIGLSMLGGFALMLAWPGNAVDPRYLAPFLIGPAIYSGFLLDKLFNSKYKVTASFICFAALINYIGFNFVPYPLHLPNFLQQFVISKERVNPTPICDWGHDLVINTITKTDGNKPVFLNVLTNMGTLHVHAFELLLKEQGRVNIVPTTSRLFTVFGDKVQFTPDQALQSQWYLWKTGSVGYKFFDEKEESKFKQVVDFVCNSGNYKLVVQKALPDGSELMLYRRKD